VAVAAIAAAVDLVDKAVTPTLPGAFHPRPASVVVVMAATSVLGLVTFPRTGSRAIAAAGGLMVGGAIGNLASLALWGAGVPNPLLWTRAGIAFNLADVCVTAGFLLLLPATLVFAVQHRDEPSARL
jgi:lipoprotein signal peptidase